MLGAIFVHVPLDLCASALEFASMLFVLTTVLFVGTLIIMAVFPLIMRALPFTARVVLARDGKPSERTQASFRPSFGIRVNRLFASRAATTTRSVLCLFEAFAMKVVSTLCGHHVLCAS